MDRGKVRVVAPTRRALLASALLAGCGRERARRSAGWLFIASASERGVAVADLADFRRVTTIPLSQTPAQVLRSGERIFVTCPDAQTIFELDRARFRASGRVDFPGKIVSAAVVPGSGLLLALTAQPAALHVVDPVARRILRRVALPDSPSGLDVTEDLAAVASSADRSITRVVLSNGSAARMTGARFSCGVIRFRMDGKVILAGASTASEIIALDVASGALLARLPMAFIPARFCFNDDGGQMFVTGAGEDAIAIVNPYQSEVDQTIVAGRTPFAMAVSPRRKLLLVTNPGSGDLTILDIETRRLAASVHIGGDPGEVLVTPDEEYALVVSRAAGDVAVIRLNTVLDHKIRTKPLFTVFAMAANPQSVAIVPKES